MTGYARAMLAQLTLEEKAALTVGRDAWTTVPVERLGIPSVWLSDGPTGLRKLRSSEDLSITNTLPATCFPTESSLAATWDLGLVEEVAGAIAAECRAEGVGVLLGPGINLKRSPLGGRNFEYFSEDPVLSGRMAAAFVSGVQARGVGACLKHLVANEHETGRMYADSIVDERTLRELYLRPFEIAVHEADPWTVMASYNRLNGEYCVESRRLLREILVEEWGFRGIVMSDWLAVNDRVASIDAGLHLQMPGSPTAAAVVEAVREGRLDEARLDELVRRAALVRGAGDGSGGAAGRRARPRRPPRPRTPCGRGGHRAAQERRRAAAAGRRRRRRGADRRLRARAALSGRGQLGGQADAGREPARRAAARHLRAPGTPTTRRPIPRCCGKPRTRRAPPASPSSASGCRRPMRRRGSTASTSTCPRATTRWSTPSSTSSRTPSSC